MDAKFFAKSATRVDLAGGTLDLWPLSTLVANTSTVNCSIDCYTSVEFSPDQTLTVDVESPDFKETFDFESVESFKLREDSKLSLLQEAFEVLKDSNKGLGRWVLKSDSPAGSGLGGSSSLLVSILKVIWQINEESYTEKILIQTAKNIESRVLKSPAGIQDYFSPVKEGLNFIVYKPSGFYRSQMNEVLDYWSDCISLVDSQIKHHSGMNNWEILKKFIDGDEEVVSAINEIAKISVKVRASLEDENLKELAQCFDEELNARKKVSSSYINDELESFLKELKAIEGVKSLKVCGAGGGGCVLMLHKPEDRGRVHKSVVEKKIALLPFKLFGDL